MSEIHFSASSGFSSRIFFVLLEKKWSATCGGYSLQLTETYSAVSMYPGEMQLTRTPACAHSTASEDAMCLTAAFAAL